MADLTPHENKKKLLIGILVRRGGGFDPLCRQAEDKIPIGIYWSERVAGLILYQDSLKVRSKSISSSDGVAGLIPHENNLWDPDQYNGQQGLQA